MFEQDMRQIILGDYQYFFSHQSLKKFAFYVKLSDLLFDFFYIFFCRQLTGIESSYLGLSLSKYCKIHLISKKNI